MAALLIIDWKDMQIEREHFDSSKIGSIRSKSDAFKDHVSGDLGLMVKSGSPMKEMTGQSRWIRDAV